MVQLTQGEAAAPGLLLYQIKATSAAGEEVAVHVTPEGEIMAGAGSD